MASESVINLTPENFKAEISNSAVPVVVDFWAEWCVPCKMFGPIFEKFAEEQGVSVKAAKFSIDSDAAQELAAEYGVRAIPTILFFKDGDVKATLRGQQSKDALSRQLQALG